MEDFAEGFSVLDGGADDSADAAMSRLSCEARVSRGDDRSGQNPRSATSRCVLSYRGGHPLSRGRACCATSPLHSLMWATRQGRATLHVGGAVAADRPAAACSGT